MLKEIFDLVESDLKSISLAISRTNGGQIAVLVTGKADEGSCTELTEALKNNLYLEGPRAELEEGIGPYLQKYNETISSVIHSNINQSVSAMIPSTENQPSTDQLTELDTTLDDQDAGFNL
jgi:hypothetical protein